MISEESETHSNVDKLSDTLFDGSSSKIQKTENVANEIESLRRLLPNMFNCTRVQINKNRVNVSVNSHNYWRNVIIYAHVTPKTSKAQMQLHHSCIAFLILVCLKYMFLRITYMYSIFIKVIYWSRLSCRHDVSSCAVYCTTCVVVIVVFREVTRLAINIWHTRQIRILNKTKGKVRLKTEYQIVSCSIQTVILNSGTELHL